MTPRNYLDQIARPNVEDFLQEPLSERRAFNAATALFHFADYLAAARGVKLADVQRELEDGFFNYGILRQVANAQKHFRLTRGKSTGVSTDNIKRGRGAAFSDGSYYSDGTSHSDARTVLRFELDGKPCDLSHLFRSALEIFEAKT